MRRMSAMNLRLQIVTVVALVLMAFPACAQDVILKKLTAEANDFYRQAKYADAFRVQQDALKIAEKTYGPSHREVATALSNLAEYQRAQGNYTEAESLLKRSLAMDQKILGYEHPDVAVDLNNLGLLYDNLGRYPDAEKLYQQALTIDEKALGTNHLGVATDLNNLAGVYLAQGKLAMAEPLYQRALAICEKSPGARWNRHRHDAQQSRRAGRRPGQKRRG